MPREHALSLRARGALHASKPHLLLVAAVIGIALLWGPLEPLDVRAQPAGTVVLDVSGEPLLRDTREGLRIPALLRDMAPPALAATVAAEDERFYLHPGVDPIAIVRAIVHWRDAPSGASTITMQLARGLYLRDSGNPPIVRKVREAWIALQLESRYSKQAILEAYLNEVYYGRNAYGLEAAARTYFGVSARDLDLAQASLLAGLPRAPGDLDPTEALGLARERQRYVLDQMIAVEALDAATAAEAFAEQLELREEWEASAAPHFALFALEEAAALRPDLAGKPGLILDTTVDAGVTREAARVASDHLQQLGDRGAHDAAVVVLDPRSGAILAMVGGVRHGDSDTGDVNLALADRQPGSALKPFLYAAALEHGYTAASELLDVPTTFQTPTGPYTPLNSDARFRGPIPLRIALASSLNVPAVRTLDEIGIASFLDMTDRAGMGSLRASARQGLTLALGGGEVRLLDLTAAYQAFPTGGIGREPYAVTRIRDTSGRVLYERAPREPQRVISPAHAFIVSDMLSDPEARQIGFGSTSALDTAARSGVKTGTTSGGRDVWAVGFNPTRVAGVWVGNADGAPMRDISSVSGAAPIWRAVMDLVSAAEDEPWMGPPDDVEAVVICSSPSTATFGLERDCAEPRTEWFVRGTEPHGALPAEHVAVLPGRDRASEIRAWERGAGVLAPRAPDANAVLILQPTPDTVFHLAPELRVQQFLVRADVPPAATRVEFRVDGAFVGEVNPSRPELVVPLSLGQHELWVGADTPNGVLSSTVTYEVVKR